MPSFPYRKPIVDRDQACKISDIFTELIKRKQMTFNSADLSVLPPFAAALVTTFLSQIDWALGSKTVDGSICLKLNDPYLQYLDIHPDAELFMWITDERNQSVHPDDAGAYILSLKNPQATFRVTKHDDGSTHTEITTPDQRTILTDNRDTDDRQISIRSEPNR